MTRADELLTYFDRIVMALAHQCPLVLEPETTEDLRRLLLTYDSDLDDAYDAGYTMGMLDA